jgi:FtsH-binding integral membrane protein
MSLESMSPEATAPPMVAAAAPTDRAAFIQRTYAHLGGAILVFTLLEVLIFQTSIPRMALSALGAMPMSWLLVMGAFMGVAWLATHLAESDASIEVQYVGLGLYVLAETLIFIPMLAMAQLAGGTTLIASAALLTLMLCTGLMVAAFATQKDFSWLGPILCVGCFVSLGLIVCSVVIGFQLGMIFSAVMILLAAGSILYDTSKVIHHYRTDQHVAASLSLFASVAFMFWYVLRLLMSFYLESDD